MILMAQPAINQGLGEEAFTRRIAMFCAWPFAALGRTAVSWINNLGAASIFFFQAILMIFQPKQFSKIVR
jgi:hypothetical protein